jgi:hypothetical protein
MDLSQAKHISAEERERRQTLGLCGYCGKKGHWRRDCKERIENEAKQVTTAQKHLGNMEDDEDNVVFHMGKDQA